MLGAKGMYELKAEGFTPFFGLTLGVASLTPPMITVNGIVTNQPIRVNGLGLVPQLGIKLGFGLYLAADYFVPTNFDIVENGTIGSVGGIMISGGFRFKLDTSR